MNNSLPSKWRLLALLFVATFSFSLMAQQPPSCVGVFSPMNGASNVSTSTALKWPGSIPVSILDSGSGGIAYYVAGAINNNLSTATQGVCSVNINFTHDYSGDLTLELISPSGQVVQLVGPTGFFGMTDETQWDISFVPCSATAIPDAEKNAVFTNNNNWGVAGYYTGSYYPAMGCLEDFNVGDVNGTWVLRWADSQVMDVGAILDFSITFCDDNGVAVELQNTILGYKLSLGTTPGGTDVMDNQDVLLTESYSPNGLLENTTYYVTVRPYNSFGEAQGCTETSFTTGTNETESCENVSGFRKLGEFEGHSYFMSDIQLTWEAAKLYAESAGGYLVTINTQAENDMLMESLGDTMVFIGFNDAGVEGLGQWANGEPVTLDLSYGNTDEGDYAVMNFWAGTWEMTYNMVVAKPFVMEMNCEDDTPLTMSIHCPTSQNLTTTTGTTIATWLDATGSTSCATGYSISQTVGMPSGSAFTIGTHLITYELATNCGPSMTCNFNVTVEDVSPTGNCDAVPGFVKLGEYDGHGYFLSENNKTWEEAKLFAESKGGYLASLNTQSENDYLQSKLGTTMVFIGLSDADSEGVVHWANGDPVTLNLSYNNTNEGDYAVMNFWAGTWEMSYTSVVSKPFVMEMDCGTAPDSISIHCPESFTVTTSTDETVVTWSEATAYSSCADGSFGVSQIIGSPSGSEFPLGVSTIGYMIMDYCDNSATCTFTISVVNPSTTLSLDCPPNMDIVTDEPVAVTWNNPIITTNCTVGSPWFTQAVGPTKGSVFSLGTHTITYLAYDMCMDTAICSFNINVHDEGASSDCDSIFGFNKLGNFNNHTYFISNNLMTWDAAKVYSESKGGYLVSLNTQAENDFIQSKLGNNMVFIGFNDATEEGVANWANGDPVTLDLSYANTDVGDYGVMNFWGGTWEMSYSNVVDKRFVMEYECMTPAVPTTTSSQSIVFPNPAQDKITLRVLAQADKDVQLFIYNAQGQQMLSKQSHLREGSNQETFHIESFGQGVYYIKVVDANQERLIRFVKLNGMH